MNMPPIRGIQYDTSHVHARIHRHFIVIASYSTLDGSDDVSPPKLSHSYPKTDGINKVHARTHPYFIFTLSFLLDPPTLLVLYIAKVFIGAAACSCRIGCSIMNVGHDERSGSEPDSRPTCPVASKLAIRWLVSGKTKI